MPPSHRHGSLATRWQFLSVLVVLIVVVSTFVYLSYANERNALSIDGRFNDWAHTEKFTMSSEAATASIDVSQWAVRTEGTRLYLYLQVEGALMGSQDVDSFYLFVDSDDYASTGYKVGGLGADFMLQIDGWNDSVRSSSLCRYGSTSDQYNWTAWTTTGSVNVAIVGSQLEAMVDMSLTLGSDARYLLLSQNELDQQSVSYVVPKMGGTLVIHQEPILANVTSGTVQRSGSVGLLRLNLFAEGSGGTVSSILPTVMGAPPSVDLGPFTLVRGETRTLYVLVDTSTVLQGSLVTVVVNPSSVDSDFAEVSIIGEAARAYVAAAPSGIVIDGAFGDWVGRIAADTDPTPILNPDVDIDSTGAVNTTQASYFYVSVKGSICMGSFVPMIKTKPIGGPGGGVVVPTRLSGEDRLRIYVDSDLNSSTGMPISMASKVIGADYLVEILGMNGAIDKITFSRYSSGGWSAVAGAYVTAANDIQRIEIRLAASAMAGSASIDFIIETTDWRGLGDIASSVPHGFKGASAGLMGGIIQGWPVEPAAPTATATATSIQRKLFYDGANFWSFYLDTGTNLVYRYSSDNGVTWSASSRVFKGAGIGYGSIWYDQATSTVYVVGDKGGGSRTVWVQRGTVSPTPAITWAAADSTVRVSTLNNGTKQAYICKDVAGYLWILAMNCTSVTPTRYDLTTMRSVLTDSITGWSWKGNMMTSVSPSTGIKGSIVPASGASNSSMDVWAIYTYFGTMASRRFNGTAWSSQTIIFNALAGTAASTIAPPSVVVDSRGVVHCVYGDDHEQPIGTSKPHIYYTYNRGSGWSTPIAISSTVQNEGFMWPTISLDSSSGNVYAFWYDMSTAAILCKKNVSGTWTSVTLTQNAYAKQYLTSIYSGPGEQYICWQWTQNTTAPIQVVFDKLPEFGSVVLPVMSMMLLFGVILGSRRSRRKDSA